MFALILIFENRLLDSQRWPGRNENCEITRIPKA